MNISFRSRADVTCRSAQSVPAQSVQPVNVFFQAVPLCRMLFLLIPPLLQVTQQPMPGSPGDTPPWQPSEDPAWGWLCGKTPAQQWLERQEKLRQREQRLAQQQLRAHSAETPPGPPESQILEVVCVAGWEGE